MADDKYKKILEQIEAEKQAKIEAEAPKSEMEYYKRKADEEAKYADSEGRTFGERAAGSLSFGLSDQFLVKQGLATPEDLRKREQYNPASALAGEVVGTVAPMLATGGTSAAAKVATKAGAAVVGAQKAGQKIGESVLKKLLKDKAIDSTAKKILKKTASEAVGSSVEGAFYGAGQLIKEDALGIKELNAENLASSVGTGMLIGGAAGGIFGGLGATVPVVSKAAAEKASKLLKKTSDVTENTMDLMGVTPAAKIKLKKKHANLEEISTEAMTTLKEEGTLKILQTSSNLAEGYAKVVDDIGNKIGKVYDELAAEGISVSKKNFYRKVETKLEDLIIQNKDIPGFGQDIKNLRRGLLKDVQDLSKRSTATELLTATDIHSIRKKVDEKLKGYYKSTDPDMNLSQSALFEVRDMLKQEIDNIASVADPTIGQELASLNKKFHSLKTFEPYIEKKASKDTLLEGIGLLDYGVMGALTALGVPTAGTAILGAKTVLKSDLKRRLIILNHIEKANKKNATKMDSALKNFFKKDFKTKPFTATSTRALINSAIARQDGKKPKDKKQALQNIKRNVEDLNGNPEKLLNTITRNTMALSYAAPEAAQQSAMIMQKQVQFLASKLPTFKSKQGVLQTLTKDKNWQPSTMEMAKFERYVEALDNPMSVMDDLESGTLSREKVEVLREVYPTIYQQVQSKAMDFITKDPEALSYKKRIQLGTLLNIPADSSLLPENIGALQRNFTKEQEQKDAKAIDEMGRYEALDMASDEMSQVERVSKK